MGGEVSDPSSPIPKNDTERFEMEFPKYLAIGMSYEQFWEQDCYLVKAYRKAQKLREEMRDSDAWLQGMYFYSALCSASPLFRSFQKGTVRAEPYEKEPFTRQIRREKQEKTRQKTMRRGFDFMLNFAQRFNKSMKKKSEGGETDERS